jgi:hypothetical protein
MEIEDVPTWKLTGLIWGLMPLLEGDSHPSVDDVYKKLDEGTFADWMRETIPAGFWPSDQPEVEAALVEFIFDVHRTTRPSKFGVEADGYLLLLAYCVEAIQHQNPA